MFVSGHRLWLRRFAVPMTALALLMFGCGARQPASAPLGGGATQRTPAIRAATPSGPAALTLPADPTLLAAVTKQQGLPAGYVPSDLVPVPPDLTSAAEPQRLRRPAAEAITRMLIDARQAGINVKVNSAYRSYENQAAVLRSEIAAFGCKQALRQVALPGHSEHQLGSAADLTSASVRWDLSDSFAATPEGRWLAVNAASYGFVLSYPEGKEAITGYRYEPWHFRYVTPSVAAAIVASGKTPTEYFLTVGNATASIAAPASQDSAAAVSCS